MIVRKRDKSAMGSANLQDHLTKLQSVIDLSQD